MKTRKIILIAADVLLLAVCIFQWISAAKDSVKNFEFKEEPDELVIEKSNGNFTLVKQGDDWLIGDKKYPANVGSVDSMVSSLKSIRALDKMGKASNEVIAARYDLTETKSINVTVNAGGKTLRKISIGKESSTGTQCYATVDGGDEVYLIAENLLNTFNKTVDDLRSKTVYQVNKDAISAVSNTDAEGNTWTVSCSGTAEDLSWSVSGVDGEVDSNAANDWFKSLATLVTTRWFGDNETPAGVKENTIRITAGTKNITVDIYKIPAAGEAEKDSFYAKCSESPYYFELPSYTVQKYKKNFSDIAK